VERERERNVILLSTEINGNNTGEVALHHSRMKVAAHPGDQMTRQHTFVEQTKSCPLRFFMETMAIAALTTYTSWLRKKKKNSQFSNI
jgi:hypothetical protein